MAIYIDADALFKEFEKAAWFNNADKDDVAEEILLNAPTADVQEVVRCKDCEHHVLTEIGFDGYPLNTPKEICKMWGKELTDMNGFCSRGKRKE